jgi:putative NADPH-quinone reductase
MYAPRILLIQGHPDASKVHLCHVLADAYAEGAKAGGFDLRQLNVARLDFELLRNPLEWRHGPLPAALQVAQDDLAWAEHIVFFFPLWLGDMPALLKGFLEQVARPGFAFMSEDGNPFVHKALTGRSARVVVTMGMPSLVYRWYFRAHSVKSLERNILGFIGIKPVNETLVGSVDELDEEGIRTWVTKLHSLGRRAV